MSRNVAVIMQTGSLLAALVASMALTGATGTPMLHAFRDAFAAARALPLGSRPSPPDLDPTSLVHTSLFTLKRLLGPSMHVDCDDLLTRPVETCVSFTYGPAPAPPVEDPPGSISVTTGGPWLLVVGLSKGRVMDAQWLGQK